MSSNKEFIHWLRIIYDYSAQSNDIPKLLQKNAILRKEEE